MGEYNNQLIVISDVAKNYNPHKNQFPWLRRQIKNKNIIYTGLSPGPEMTAARQALELNIPYIAAIPYKKYPLFWPRFQRNEYYRLLKKAVKTIYIDREEGYICDFYPPDEYSSIKFHRQIDWLIARIHLCPGITKVISYTSGFSSCKNRNLQRFLNDSSLEGKWHLIQRTHLSIMLEEDDLPF